MDHEPNLVGSRDLGGVFFVDGDSGQLRGIASQTVFDSWGFMLEHIYWCSTDQASSISASPRGPNLTSLASHGGGVYLVQNQTFRPIFDANTLNIFKDNWGLGWSDLTADRQL